MADTPMEKRKEKVSFMERLSEFKKTFFRFELLVFIPILYILGILLKKYIEVNVYYIISIVSILICECYMFLKIDFKSLESIVIGLIMGAIQAFVLTSGSTYLLLKYKK